VKFLPQNIENFSKGGGGVGKLFFLTLPFFGTGISLFSQFVSVFSTFKLFVPLNRNSKKFLHALEVLASGAGTLQKRDPM